MEKIPGIVYLAVGIFVAVVSKWSGKLDFFFYVGLVFVAIGIFRIGTKYVTGQEPGRIIPSVIHCPKCQTPCYTSSNFCHICGFKLKTSTEERLY